MREAARFTETERRLLDAYQRGFPLCPRPYAAIADELGLSEGEVIAMIDRFVADGVIARVGAVVTPHTAGWSTLAAMAVPEARLEAVAAFVSACPEVNHNYEREHRFNLWFVVAGVDEASVRSTIDRIEAECGLPVMVLPLDKPYRIDLGFPLQWS